MPENSASNSQDINISIPEFKAAEQLKKIIPHWFIFPGKFNRKFDSDRRVKSIFVNLGQLKNLEPLVENFLSRVNNPRSSNWADFLIVFYIPQNHNELKLAYKTVQENPFAHQRVFLALPVPSSSLTDILQQFSTIKLNKNGKPQNSEDNKKYNTLRERLKELLKWQYWNWFYQGKVISKKKKLSLKNMASYFLEKIYNRAFNPGTRDLSRHHNLSNALRKRIRLAVTRILQLKRELTHSHDENDATSEIFQTLINLGILKVRKPGWVEQLEMKQPDENSPVHELWSYLDKDLLNQALQGKHFYMENIMNRFLNPPFGVTSGLFKLIFAIFWRKHHEKISIYMKKENKLKSINNLTYQRLIEMMRRGQNWIISKYQESQEEQKYILNIFRTLDPIKADEKKIESVFEDTRQALFNWLDKLPGFMLSQEYEHPNASAFLQAIEENREKTGKELFLKYIPSALGYESGSFQIDLHGENIKNQIDQITEEIDQKAFYVVETVWQKIMELFKVDSANEDKFLDILEDWLENAEAGKFKETFQKDSLVLFETINSRGDVRALFLRQLPEKLGMGNMYEWKTDKTSELLARLDRAKLQIGMQKYMKFKEFSNWNQRKDLFNKWITHVLKDLKFNREEGKKFIQSFLTEMSQSK